MPLSADGPLTRREPLLLDRVYGEIKSRIVQGRYAPGMPLSESVLARLHRASRTPVREALSRLLEEQYVARSDVRGYVVAPVTLSGVRHTFEVRRVLETTAAALAAERAEAGDIARMRALAEYPELERNDESYHARLSINDEFHLAVAASTGNDLLVDLIGRCLLQHDRVLSLTKAFPVLAPSVPQHHAIIEAIERRDAAEARLAMEQHLNASNQLVTDFLMSGKVRGVQL